MSEPLVYDLTPLTRRAAASRRSVVGGFDVETRTLWVLGISLVPALLSFGLLLPFVGTWAILAVPVVLMAGVWFINGRSQRGMKLKNWQTALDKARNRNGDFFICGHEIDIFGSEITWIRTLTAPVSREAPDDPFGD